MKKKTKITIYSSPFCPACSALKDFLTRNNIKYKDVNVLENKKEAEKAVQLSGQRSIPITIVNDSVILGFREDEWEKIIEEF